MPSYVGSLADYLGICVKIKRWSSRFLIRIRCEPQSIADAELILQRIPAEWRKRDINMNFPVKLGVVQPSSSFVFPTASSDGKSTNSSLTLPSSTTRNPNGALFTKVSQSVRVDETKEKVQFQALVDVLRDGAETGSVKNVKNVHGILLKSRFSDHESLVLWNHVVHAYSKCSDFVTARQLFDKMSDRNIFSWTVMIVGSTENGFFDDGLKFFSEMQNQGILPDKFAYSAILQTCIGLESIELGEMVHAQIVVRGFTCHTFVTTALLNMYAKLGKIEESSKAFRTMTERNVVSWNALISGYTLNGLHLEAFSHFLRMKDGEIMPNKYTFISVAKAVGMLGDANKGKEVHKYASDLGIDSDVYVGTALIDMYSRCSLLPEARAIFYSYFINCGINTPWNAMISGYSQSEYKEEVLALYLKMCKNGVSSDHYTYCSVFNVIASLKFLEFGKQIHGMVVKSSLAMHHLSISNALADAYAKCGSLEEARKVFSKMEERDLVSWTTLLTASCQCSDWDHALEIFSEMIEQGFTPNEYTFSSLLIAIASLCLLDYGQQIHGLICKVGLDSEKCVESALIDMYAKCGCVKETEKVFKRIANPDTISWTAIILGYSQHGLVEEALQLFIKMEQMGVKPNAVTLLCVLFACSHGGMVEEGLNYFKLMTERYRLDPEMEHYGCIVDLLGRVGRLNDAMKFINNMPIEPNEMVWQSLLGACRVHGNVELGETAARKILSFKPDYSAPYVLLSNTYMEKGSYKDGNGMRHAMKERGVKKEPGCSWISVKGKLHKFYAGDEQHPQRDDIYAMLAELRDKVKLMDYVPDLIKVL